jgi:hypothetical protein
VLIARHFYHDFDDSKMFFPFSEQLHVSVKLIEEMTDLVYLKSNSVEEASHHVNKRLSSSRTGDAVEEFISPKKWLRLIDMYQGEFHSQTV